MHEYGVTSMLVKRIIQIAMSNGAKKVLEVEMEIGEFTFLNFDQVIFCYSTLIEDTILSESTIKLKRTKGTVKCKSCDYIGPINQIIDEEEKLHSYISYSCPECAQKVDIIDGKSFTIKGIKFKN